MIPIKYISVIFLTDGPTTFEPPCKAVNDFCIPLVGAPCCEGLECKLGISGFMCMEKGKPFSDNKLNNFLTKLT